MRFAAELRSVLARNSPSMLLSRSKPLGANFICYCVPRVPPDLGPPDDVPATKPIEARPAITPPASTVLRHHDTFLTATVAIALWGSDTFSPFQYCSTPVRNVRPDTDRAMLVSLSLSNRPST